MTKKEVFKVLDFYGEDNIIFGGSFALYVLGYPLERTVKDLDFIVYNVDHKFSFKSAKFNPVDTEPHPGSCSKEEFIGHFKYKGSNINVVRDDSGALNGIPHDIFIYDKLSVLGDNIYLEVIWFGRKIKVLNLKTQILVKSIFTNHLNDGNTKYKHENDIANINDLKYGTQYKVDCF